MASSSDFWQDDVAGFPVWQLGIAVIGSIVAIIIFKHFTSGSSSTATPTSSSGSGSTGGGGGYVSPTTPNPTTGTSAVQNWLASAQSVANALGISTSAANNALQNYLAGNTIYTGSGERSILSSIFSAIGEAPGVAAPSYYVPTPASSTTGSTTTPTSTGSTTTPTSTTSSIGSGGTFDIGAPLQVVAVASPAPAPITNPVTAAIKAAAASIASFSSTPYARSVPESATAAASAQSQATISSAEAAGSTPSQAQTIATNANNFQSLNQSQQTYANLLASGSTPSQAASITQNAAASSAMSANQQTYNNLIAAHFSTAQATQISGWNQA